MASMTRASQFAAMSAFASVQGINRRRASRAVAAALASSLLVSPLARADFSVDALYDFRHATDAQDNANNFPVIEIKLFYPASYGSLLLKQEIDLDGKQHNASQIYTELDQSIKLGNVTVAG